MVMIVYYIFLIIVGKIFCLLNLVKYIKLVKKIEVRRKVINNSKSFLMLVLSDMNRIFRVLNCFINWKNCNKCKISDVLRIV